MKIRGDKFASGATLTGRPEDRLASVTPWPSDEYLSKRQPPSTLPTLCGSYTNVCTTYAATSSTSTTQQQLQHINTPEDLTRSTKRSPIHPPTPLNMKANTIISLGLMATLGTCSSYTLQAFQTTDCSGTGQTPITGGAHGSSCITGVMALGSWQFLTTSDLQLDIYASDDCSGAAISMTDGGCLQYAGVASPPGPAKSSKVISSFAKHAKRAKSFES